MFFSPSCVREELSPDTRPQFYFLGCSPCQEDTHWIAAWVELMEGPLRDAVAWPPALPVSGVLRACTTGAGHSLGWERFGIGTGQNPFWQVLQNLRYVKSRWSDVRVIWSTIILRIAWHNALAPRAMHKARKNANREVARALSVG